MKIDIMEERIFDLEDRLVRFAGEMVFYVKTLPSTDVGKHYANQVMRSSGSSALNYGEAQGTTTEKDFVHKMSLVLKELKESQVILKILEYVKIGDEEKRDKLLKESKELAAISAKMILNKKKSK